MKLESSKKGSILTLKFNKKIKTIGQCSIYLISISVFWTKKVKFLFKLDYYQMSNKDKIALLMFYDKEEQKIFLYCKKSAASK